MATSSTPKKKRDARKLVLEKNLKSTEDDAIMAYPHSTDLVIPVIGATGSGKSAFVNLVLPEGVKQMSVGGTPESCTKRVDYAVLQIDSFIQMLEDIGLQKKLEPLRGRRLVLVDTPGFEDAELGDAEVLRRISVWLAFSYNDEMKVAGAVYLHDITLLRANKATRATVDMFHVLCGNDALRRVVLTSTKWDRIPTSTGMEREKWYMENPWEPLLKLGSGALRHYGIEVEPLDGDPSTSAARASACAVIAEVLGRYLTTCHCQVKDQDRLEIQGELVQQERRLPETEAGRVLVQELKATKQRHKIMLKKLREAGVQDTEPRYAERQKALEETRHQIEELKVPLSRKVLLGLGLA